MQTEDQYIAQITAAIRGAGVVPPALLLDCHRATRRLRLTLTEWIGKTGNDTLLATWQAHTAVQWDGPINDMLRRLLWIEASRRKLLEQLMTDRTKRTVEYLLTMAQHPISLPSVLGSYQTPLLKDVWDAMDHYHPDRAGSETLVEELHAEMNRRGEGYYVAV